MSRGARTPRNPSIRPTSKDGSVDGMSMSLSPRFGRSCAAMGASPHVSKDAAPLREGPCSSTTEPAPIPQFGCFFPRRLATPRRRLFSLLARNLLARRADVLGALLGSLFRLIERLQPGFPSPLWPRSGEVADDVVSRFVDMDDVHGEVIVGATTRVRAEVVWFAPREHPPIEPRPWPRAQLLVRPPEVGASLSRPDRRTLPARSCRSRR